MNRKIMDGLSYGFYFIIICLIFLTVYLLFFKDNTSKKNNDVSDNGESGEQIVNESIKLNKTTISLDIGESFNLKATIVPSNGSEVINFSSSDDKVATVDENGVISGVDAGEATILVTVEGTSLKAECNVSVSENIVNVSGLFVNEDNIKINKGDTYQINVKVIPNNAVDKTLIFSSNNEKVISVDENGLVKALGFGLTKVIIKSKANPDVQIEVNFVVQNG